MVAQQFLITMHGQRQQKVDIVEQASLHWSCNSSRMTAADHPQLLSRQPLLL
jgi:hypothetical protein